MTRPVVSEVEIKTENNDTSISAGYLTNMGISFETIYNEYGNMIYTYFLHQVSDRETANDLFQDVMLKILNSVKNYQATGSVKSWLIVIARNHLLDHRRRKSRWRKLITPGIIIEELEGRQKAEKVIPFAHPAGIVEAEENQLRINRALVQLPEEQREVIDFHYNCDLSLKQISEILDCSINTIASRLRYGLKKLKKLLEA